MRDTSAVEADRTANAGSQTFSRIVGTGRIGSAGDDEQLEQRTMKVTIKRVYEPAVGEDGVRVLIDRLWPRGLSKAAAGVDVWLKDLAPSHELRRWFDHEAEKWPEFQRRYASELDGAGEAVARLRALAARGRVTLLFGSRELVYNNATALAAYLASWDRR